MMKPEQEVRERIKEIFDMRNINEMANRTGYPRETLRSWKNNPLRIKAIDLIRLEYLVGIDYLGRLKKLEEAAKKRRI